MNLTACRVIKAADPDCRLIFSVNKRYEDVIEILKLSEDIDDFIVWENYDNWPSESDKKKLEELVGGGFLSGHIFHPMPPHPVHDWYNYWHQTEEVCVMHNLPRPTAEQMDFKLKKPDLVKENTITLCAARRVEKEGHLNDKALTLGQIEVVKEFAEDKGLKVIQIGGPEEEGIEGVEKFKGDYSESVLKVLKSRLLVSADTGMIWAASAFSHSVIGLYSNSHYRGASSCKHWIPKNKNQKTIVREGGVENIPPDFLWHMLLNETGIKNPDERYSMEQQDVFVKKLIGENGFFLDIGCGHPTKGNNTKLLEESGWDGLAFDVNPDPQDVYRSQRKAKFYEVDSTSPKFIDILKSHTLEEVDYISLDIDEFSMSCLEKIISAGLKFKCMTFEHTYFSNPDLDRREESRKLLINNGYKPLFKDVVITSNRNKKKGEAFEDWWVNESIFKKFNKIYKNMSHRDIIKLLEE